MINIHESTIEEALLINRLIPEFSPNYIENNIYKLRDKEKLVLVAKYNKDLAGYAICYDQYEDGSLYIWLLGVVPDYREKGIMKEIMSYIYTWAKNKKYLSIKVKTQNKRKEMIYALIKQGFNFIQVEENPDINEAKILLSKLL